MGKYKGRIPQEIREKILSSVQDDGLSIKQASREYEVSDKTIHNWLRQESQGVGNISHDAGEIRRLKKDKEDLLKLIGALNFELEKTKKKR